VTRLIGVLVVLSTGCAAKAPAPAPVPRPVASVAPVPLVDMTPAKGGDVPSLDSIEDKGKAEMPLMRVVSRVEGVKEPISVSAADGDTCFRAVVAASAPVKAWFIDATHTPRGEIADAAGSVPPRGPVCARKGEVLRLVIHSTTAGALTRAVVWASP
jgi:hypothetical protein